MMPLLEKKILWTRDRTPHTNTTKESESISIAGPT